jgi:hypothetical protein
MLFMGIHTTDFQAFGKRFYNATDGVLWREYHGVQMLHIYGTADVLLDVPFLQRRLCDSPTERFVFLEGVQHGGSLFGKRAHETLTTIRGWLLDETRVAA